MNTIELISSRSAAASVVSPYFDLGDKIDYAIQVFFTGSNVTGTLSLEASVDIINGFVTIQGSVQPVVSSLNHVWNVTGAGYRYVRVRWAYTSGTGNILSELFLKDK